MPILQAKNLYKHFDGVAAVDRISFQVEKRKITGVIGPNGSGKSTLVNLLTGMVPLDGGVIVFSETTKLSRVRPYEIASFGITRTFQDVRLFEQMTALDNILVVLTERNLAGALFERHTAFHEEKAKEVLERVGLWEKRREKAVNLSYGQRKLLEVARALAMAHSAATGSAEVFLFDEPFAGLFPEMIKTVSRILRELRSEGKAVVLIEHNMELIRELSDTVIVLDAGALLAEGAPADVLSRPAVIEAYLGE